LEGTALKKKVRITGISTYDQDCEVRILKDS
jgi:hypothetical protein